MAGTISLMILRLAFLLSLSALPAAADLTADQFQRLHRELQPPKEAWTTIPWHSSLIPAQHQAAEENKPLFIWAMDGHPLGCT